MACPKCRANHLVEIGVNVSGRSVKLHSCSRCDTRWWDDERGEVVGLREIIDLATVRR
ncbi:MAG TPA: hypothetical protein VHN98_06360 [Acidimicrobiales bacterium]|nr:hypothetical protein [Acidimicrobiales bacterium]